MYGDQLMEKINKKILLENKVFYKNNRKINKKIYMLYMVWKKLKKLNHSKKDLLCHNYKIIIVISKKIRNN